MSAYAETWASIRAALHRDTLRKDGVTQTQFLPAALELVERPVSPLARRTALVLALGMAVLIAWLFLGRVDIVAAADGALEPIAHVQLVQPATPGIVRRLLVRDGQRVRKGQLLVALDPTIAGGRIGAGARCLIIL